MTIVVINYLEQVLCMNEWNEVQCKPMHLLSKRDKVCFKLLDLLLPSNPGKTNRKQSFCTVKNSQILGRAVNVW